jgi:hypothetical protein
MIPRILLLQAREGRDPMRAQEVEPTISRALRLGRFLKLVFD